MEGSRRPPYVVHRRTKKVRICDSDSTTTGIDCTGAAAVISSRKELAVDAAHPGCRCGHCEQNFRIGCGRTDREQPIRD